MRISVINLDPAITTSEVLHIVRAINVQIERDFRPYWHMGATLRLDSSVPHANLDSLPGLRGDAVIYLAARPDAEFLGFHERHNSGVPFGFVFTDIAAAIGEPWSVTLSHEALELLADPECNLLCKGPHPDPGQKGRMVFHWFEMCDAVQAESYEIDGVAVSNFVLPLYFTGADELDGRNDFLALHNSHLKSFGINPGGYVGFFDPRMAADVTFAHADSAKRMRAKDAVSPSYRRADRRKSDHPITISTTRST